jgi:predicted secreted protein
MGERQEQGSNFPVKVKKKLRVVVRDTFEDLEDESADFLLSQLDSLEKNELDIRRAVEDSSAPLPVPEVHKRPESRLEYLRSGVAIASVPRCFAYDTDFFEPVHYFADEADLEWLAQWNRAHSFLQISPADLEMVFGTLEFIVKDAAQSEEPKLARLLMLLPPGAPPLAVVAAVHEHWRGREKVNGSVLRWREWPPDHADLRAKVTTINRNLAKTRKALGDVDYLKKLYEKLKEMQGERQKAQELLQRQQEAQIRDERFVRNAMRTVSKNAQDAASMLIMPAPRAAEKVDEIAPPQELRAATVPAPPTSPSFLKWCLAGQRGN